MQEVMIKKGIIQSATPVDEIESNKEKKMSLNKLKRDSVHNMNTSLYGRDHFKCADEGEQNFMNILKASTRFGHSAVDGQPSSVRKRKVTLQSVTKKMVFALRLRVKKKKVVIDEEKNIVVEIIHLKELTDLEILNIWFSEAEMQEIKWNNAEIAASMDNGMSLEEADGRGLEGRTEEGGWNKYKMRKDAVNDVLDEFDRQFDDGLVEWEVDKIREAYMPISEQAIKEAAGRGSYDENAVKDFLQDELEELEEKWKKIDQQKLKKREQ